MGDWITCFVMGIIGFVMKRSGWPRPPLILALILGNIMENSFQISMRVHDGWGWVTKPIIVIIIVLIVLTIVFAVKNAIKKKRIQPDESDNPVAGEGAERNPLISLPFSLIFAVASIWAGFEAQPWPFEVKQFPISIAFPTAVFVTAILLMDFRDLFAKRRELADWGVVFQVSSEQAVLARSLTFFGYLVVMILATYVIGQKIALPIFIGLYLWRWGHYSKRLSISYAVGGWAFIVIFYDQIMNLLFHTSWLHRWLRPEFPEWLPKYLIF